jgi:hypothetical protein
MNAEDGINAANLVESRIDRGVRLPVRGISRDDDERAQ